MKRLLGVLCAMMLMNGAANAYVYGGLSATPWTVIGPTPASNSTPPIVPGPASNTTKPTVSVARVVTESSPTIFPVNSVVADAGLETSTPRDQNADHASFSDIT